MNLKEQIGLNFIRPDVNRPGHFDFVNKGSWLVDQYKKIGLQWNRLAFSWPMIQPERDCFDWSVYDTVMSDCEKSGIHVLATIGGHFDDPPVPIWAGKNLKDVVDNHPDYFVGFIQACAERYKGHVFFWEILNEPYQFHTGLTVIDYIDKILKPAYTIIKSIDHSIKVLPCAYSHLPILGDKSYFWTQAKGYFDIFNLHMYPHWGYLRLSPSADPEAEYVSGFRQITEANGEGDKPIWITETGWFGTAGIAHGFYGFYNVIPDLGEMVDYREVIKPSYLGKEIVNHPVTYREDDLRSEWLKQLFSKLFEIPGCEKVFLWSSMDEFEGGYDANTQYGRIGNISGIDNASQNRAEGVRSIDMWGMISGDGQWRKSAYTLQEILRDRD